MNKLNKYTFEMKMKRHKLAYSYSTDLQTLTLGKASIGLSSIILKVLLPLLVGLIAILVVIYVPLILRIAYTLMLVIAFTTIAYSISSVFMLKRNRKSNQLTRHLSQGKISLESKNNNPRNFELIDIQKLLTKVTHNDENGASGLVQFQDKKGEIYDLIGIIDKDKFKLEEDLKYIRDYLAMFIGLEKESASEQ